VMLELFPEGFEEVERADGVELVAYTDPGGEERLWQAFGGGRSSEVPGGWEDRWRAFHRPVRVGPLWIGPPWEDPPTNAVAVRIDPGRAFGTGAHATTRLCLELLADLPRGSLMDLGCGSGVVAIASGRLGFGPVLAMDVDPAAVEATERNARANDVRVETRLGDLLRDSLPDADVAIANLTLDLVESLGPRLNVRAVVTSGYLVADRPKLAGFAAVDRRVSDGWAADLHERHKQ
jgi:ribosomal protein L11 methyltransferase